MARRSWTIIDKRIKGISPITKFFLTHFTSLASSHLPSPPHACKQDVLANIWTMFFFFASLFWMVDNLDERVESIFRLLCVCVCVWCSHSFNRTLPFWWIVRFSFLLFTQLNSIPFGGMWTFFSLFSPLTYIIFNIHANEASNAKNLSVWEKKGKKGRRKQNGENTWKINDDVSTSTMLTAK